MKTYDPKFIGTKQLSLEIHEGKTNKVERRNRQIHYYS